MTAGSDIGIRSHPYVIAFREDDQGNLEKGRLYFIKQVRSVGRLRATYEYNLYYWPQSRCWTGDVISPLGWHDIDEEEVLRVAQSCGVAEATEQSRCFRERNTSVAQYWTLCTK